MTAALQLVITHTTVLRKYSIYTVQFLKLGHHLNTNNGYWQTYYNLGPDIHMMFTFVGQNCLFYKEDIVKILGSQDPRVNNIAYNNFNKVCIIVCTEMCTILFGFKTCIRPLIPDSIFSVCVENELCCLFTKWIKNVHGFQVTLVTDYIYHTISILNRTVYISWMHRFCCSDI